MHSYWDDLFALKGLKDAAWLASQTGLVSEAERLGSIGREFGADLRLSIERSMQVHGIDYIPGAADLGDFDATSTTIALDPTNAGDIVPSKALERTANRSLVIIRALERCPMQPLQPPKPVDSSPRGDSRR